jgi:pectate lyase
VYVYHNSIHLYGSVNSSSTNSNPSCLAIQSGITGGVYVRNNIFQNTQTPGAASSTRRTIAVAYQGSSPNVFAELDNNAYYVDNANGAQYAFIGALGSNVYATLTDWRGAVGSTREQNSIQLSAGAPFQSNDTCTFRMGRARRLRGEGP